MFCFSTKEEAEQVLEYRQNQLRLASTAAQRAETAKEEETSRAEAIAALTAETGKTNFDKTTIQNKIVHMQKMKEAEEKKSVNVILKTDVAGSMEGLLSAFLVIAMVLT